MIEQLELTAEEQQILSMLKRFAPYLLVNYTDSIEEARASTLRRFVMSLIREDIKGVYSKSNVIHNTIAEKPMPLLAEGSYYIYPMQEGLLCFPYEKMYAFRRIEPGATVFHITGEKVETYTSAVQVALLLDQREAWGTLLAELDNSSANLALSLAYWKYRKRATISAHESTIDYVIAQTKQKNFDAALFFEQLAVLGHNLHPCAKTRVGMSSYDVLQYAPEFNQAFPLRFVAVKRHEVEECYVDGDNPLLQDNSLVQAMNKQGLSIEEYAPVPVHPWQLAHIIPAVYKEELQAGTIALIAGYEQGCLALSSFRTVQTEAMTVKTAIHAQMTSTIRSISPQTANNAAVFTELLQQVMKREEQLQTTFVPVYEWGGGSFRSDDVKKKRNLSFVLREKVVTSEQELAVTGTALYSESIVSELPIVLELIAQYEKTAGYSSTQEAASRWFSHYASLMLQGFLTMMVKYGVGLEGHLQNSIPVFQNGRPVRMLFRDWGGARLYAPRLKQRGFSPAFYPNSLVLTDSLAEMHNKVFYTVIQNHLGEIVYLLCKHVGLAEEKCWQEVRHICEHIFNELAAEHAEAVQQDRAAFFAALVDYKALLTMRIRDGEKAYSYVKVENPLTRSE